MFPGGYCAGWGTFGWLMMIGFWVALVGVAVWAVARFFPSAGSTGSTPPPPPAPPMEEPAPKAVDALPPR